MLDEASLLSVSGRHCSHSFSLSSIQLDLLNPRGEGVVLPQSLGPHSLLSSFLNFILNIDLLLVLSRFFLFLRQCLMWPRLAKDDLALLTLPGAGIMEMSILATFKSVEMAL